jgi:predicted transcriptional regulator
VTTIGKIMKHKRLTGDERAKVADALAARYNAGATIRQLAAETGRSYGFINRIIAELHDAGRVVMRPRGGTPGPDRPAGNR